MMGGIFILHTIPVNHIAGVGPNRQRDLFRLGIYTVSDVLHYYPFRYENREAVHKHQLRDKQRVTVQVIIDSVPTIRFQGKRSTLSVSVRTVDGMPMMAVWFNRPFLRDQIQPAQSMMLTGLFDERRRSIVVSHYEFTHTHTVHSNRVVPVYEIRGDLTPKVIRSLIANTLRLYGAQVEELIPARLMEKYHLLSHKDALQQIHFPKNDEGLRQARRRLIFEEFFLFQLKLQAFRTHHLHEQPGVRHMFEGNQLQPFLQQLPFDLTGAQRRVLREIIQDMRNHQPMNRLLQGDVGSGKTVVAMLSLFVSYLAGYQAALMVPTEILAEQHFHTAEKMLMPLGLRIGLLVSGQKDSVRKEILKGLSDGTIDVLIGTHAVLQEGVQFRQLSLVITDEQHRFGVRQRAVFRQKGHHPDVLFMSATPIPRTLAMTVFGDLDISVLDELPRGRKPITTHWLSMNDEAKAIRLVRAELAKGRQAYVVAPLIEVSDKLEGLENAVHLLERLTEEFAGYKVGLLHGRLSSKEKEDTMRRFQAHEIHVLVSTTVIEVGVDVPNSSMMMIYNADRFGLAQLHQLRGRVGRGQWDSFCLLLADPVTETGIQRMQAMVETQNGFELAEKDLELRGPGEFFGMRQSGLPQFRLGNLVTDANIMEVAKREASDLLIHPDRLRSPEHHALMQVLQQTNEEESPVWD